MGFRPNIIASLLGILMLITGIKFPSVLDKTLFDLSRVATPLALAILGASFEFSAISGCLKQFIIWVLGKLVIVPIIFIPLSILAGVIEIELATLLIMFSAPVSINSFTMA